MHFANTAFLQKAAAQVRCPTLIINSDRDPMVPIEEGRILAGLIPGARFVQLSSKNHMLLPEEPAWNRLVTEVESFLPELETPRLVNDRARFADLTVRERAVLAEMAAGLGNAEIAVQLDLSEKTVRNHITYVFDKIGVRRRYQAIVLARDAGMANEPSIALGWPGTFVPGRVPLTLSSAGLQSQYRGREPHTFLWLGGIVSLSTTTGGTDMPKFVIERELKGAGMLAPTDLQAISQKSCGVLRSMGPTIQWVQSFVTDDKIYCVFIAPDEAAVRQHAIQGGFPANSIAQVRSTIDPTTAE